MDGHVPAGREDYPIEVDDPALRNRRQGGEGVGAFGGIKKSDGGVVGLEIVSRGSVLDRKVDALAIARASVRNTR
jgi:hypothetical protein